ncbi:unnamed protein product [Rotaria sordida]|uniref:Uncharacterized protein n=1 Tax=Rotaria sordida TaxID=392033 RepID=A0A815UG20_9BILA|nr:unnamed protein product [Rotaria sordida]CAF1518983.1 unnamed protein product [Rotaria sordida]
MTQQVHSNNYDDDDDFEILYDTSSIEVPHTFESHDSKSLSLTNMDSIVEKPITHDNQIINEIKPSSSINFNNIPLRYGSAADIPYEEGFDLKTILNSKPIIPSNDIMNLLNTNKLQQQQQQQHGFFTNNLNELLISYTRDHENRIQIARQTQQDFINAMNLD